MISELCSKDGSGLQAKLDFSCSPARSPVVSMAYGPLRSHGRYARAYIDSSPQPCKSRIKAQLSRPQDVLMSKVVRPEEGGAMDTELEHSSFLRRLISAATIFAFSAFIFLPVALARMTGVAAWVASIGLGGVVDRGAVVPVMESA